MLMVVVMREVADRHFMLNSFGKMAVFFGGGERRGVTSCGN